MSIEIPKGLGRDGRDFYERVAAQLDEAGTLTPAAELLLERAARTWAQIRKWERYLARKDVGWTMEVGRGGYRQKRPEVGYVENARKWLIEAMRELKVTPASSDAGSRSLTRPVDQMRGKLAAAKAKALKQARETVQ